MAEPTPIQIDIVSDVMCPWCYIGQKRLQKALHEVGVEVDADIHWRPYQLDPTLPAEGKNADGEREAIKNLVMNWTSGRTRQERYVWNSVRELVWTPVWALQKRYRPRIGQWNITRKIRTEINLDQLL